MNSAIACTGLEATSKDACVKHLEAASQDLAALENFDGVTEALESVREKLEALQRLDDWSKRM